jgi:hypothetical protein
MNIRLARRAMLESCRYYGALDEKHEQNEPCRRYTTKEKNSGKAAFKFSCGFNERLS